MPRLAPVMSATLPLSCTVMVSVALPGSVERSAGDVHDLSGHEARVVAGEERDGVGDVLGVPHTLHGDLRGRGGLELLEAHADPGRGCPAPRRRRARRCGRTWPRPCATGRPWPSGTRP